MDYDVESWVEEEARRGRGRRASHAPAPSAAPSPFGISQSQPPATTSKIPGGDFGFAPPLPGAVPATPFTPGFGGGIGAFGKGADATPYATEAFLRRAPPTAKAAKIPSPDRSTMTAPSRDARAAPHAMDDDDVLDDAHAVEPGDDPRTAAAKDLETDDAPHERREEFAFAEVLAAVRAGVVTAREAAGAFEEACWERSFELREESASCVHRTVKAAELARAADLLQAEAGTWSLVWFLLGDGAAIEADGAASEAAARAVIAQRQAAGGDPASAIDSGVPNPAPLPPPLSARIRIAARDQLGDPVTFRLNRVVAWLEGTARAAMQRERAGLVPVPDEHAGTHVDDFASGECAWRETAVALEASATTDGRGRTLCRALDPDGPARTATALHPTNADGEDRLLRATWRLTRAGMVDAARELCARAGQPWRAASLGGAAGFAPAPVGAAADDAFARSAAKPVADALERAEAEAEAGADPAATKAALVEATTAAALSAAAEREDEEAASECERGGGAAKRALWKWACAETARQTSAAGGNGVASYSRFESALYGAFAGDLRWMLGACDGDWESSAWAHFRALLDARVDAVIDGRDPGTPGPVLVDDDDDGSGDKRKADSSLDGTSGEADAVGAGLLAGLNQSAAPRWPTPEALAAIPPTAEAILDALKPLGGGEHRRAQGCLILGRTRELVVDNVLRWLFPGMDPKTLDGDTDEASVHAALVDSPVHSPELLRFAAHLLLFLRELLPDGGGLQPDGSLDRHLNAVVARFVLHLVQSRRYHLVPRYARHLRASLLVETYSRFLTRLAPASAELKARCLDEACAWIPREGDGGVRSIVVRALDDSREVVDARGVPDAPSLSRGPAHRERVLEWATLAGAELHPEAAVHACALIRQLCLQRSAAARLRGCDRPHLTLDPRDFVCGEERARRIVARLLPSDLQANAAERGRPGAATELSDWAAYLAACAAVGAWRDLAAARDARAALDAEEGGADLNDSNNRPGGGGARLAAEAATAAIGAIVDLASPRLADSDGFYQPDVVDSFDPGVDGPGYWLDSPALVDAEEAAMETESRSPTVRLVAVALPDRTVSGGGDAPRGLGGTDPHETAAALAEALELRVGTIADPIVAGAVRCHVEVTRGCVGEGARAEGAKGQILVEITADIDRLNLPVAPGTPPAAIGAAYDAAAVAARDVVGRARREIALVAADAVKGDLPRIRAAGRGGACADPPPLDVQSADGSDPEMIRLVCRAVCWPSLLLEGVEIEADLGSGSSAVCELVADAGRGLHELFSRRELTWMLHLQRQGEVNAIAAGARGGRD
jgi:nuclear pore complex protein Nup107